MRFGASAPGRGSRAKRPRQVGKRVAAGIRGLVPPRETHFEEQLDQRALVALFRGVMLRFEIDADSVVVDTESARVRVSLDALIA